MKELVQIGVHIFSMDCVRLIEKKDFGLMIVLSGLESETMGSYSYIMGETILYIPEENGAHAVWEFFQRKVINDNRMNARAHRCDRASMNDPNLRAKSD